MDYLGVSNLLCECEVLLLKYIYFVFSLFLVVCIAGCGEPDVFDMLDKMREEERERVANLTPEEREVEELAREREIEEEKRVKEAEREQYLWELDNTDLIHYKISRYSSDGIYVDEGKYILTPLLDETHLDMRKLKNRGVNSESSLIVNDAFLGGSPNGKFDIYYIVWLAGGREPEDVVRVGVGYEDISRGW